MDKTPDIPSRPELTLPEAEAIALSKAYAQADTILEYGSGGSTVIAAELGKTVWSVESDADWAQMMRDYFAAHPPMGDVHIVHSDIGPTKEWGHPVDDSEWKKFPRYPLQIWDNPGFEHPDVVLVDGRFRVGCALATAFRITRPVTLYFDDYKRRERFHVVEEFLGQPEDMIGRMARFEITPTPVPRKKLLKVVQLMLRP
ncbi:hypothetical protein TG4357_00307 [Thalassovita gelatinovora]|uniref:Uncharacterized protein n=1 Tax=Thalassovita gelatinovora TaxID=53501 RepID=A0A0P1F4R1_THAGE|nr:hypothetical protein [Thalassovita gelatinovora]QIZ79434.1 hypothetical protein HFZ77_02570 [Thalassovita gelatinovora]CUH62796.1 hypothetical protein TG4357_00307 [Thalassovita gelatinovora]SEQ10341.1 hypothetical protein SAMN04488043_103207 [Thalassovita gelatinovora]